jgi:hypothetical protein
VKRDVDATQGIGMRPLLPPRRAPRLRVMRRMEFVGVTLRLGARTPTHHLAQEMIVGELGLVDQFVGATRRLGAHCRRGPPPKPPTGVLRPIVRGRLLGKRRRGVALRDTLTGSPRPRRRGRAWNPPPGWQGAAIPEGPLRRGWRR